MASDDGMQPQKDLVTRLRELSQGGIVRNASEGAAMREAADEIERLESLLDPCLASKKGSTRVHRCNLRVGHLGSHKSDSMAWIEAHERI